MKTKNIMISTFIYLFLVTLIFLIGCNTKKEIKKIKIGADFTLTGNLAFWSTELKKGMDFAKEKCDTLNRIEIIYEDNRGKASNAVAIFKKLVSTNNVNSIISCFTPIGQPLRGLAKELKTPLIATVTSAKKFASINDWTFRDFPTQNQQVTALAKYVYNNLNLRRGSYLVVNDDYGMDGAKLFKKGFNDFGGDFYVGENFLQTDKNMRNQITKVLKQNPEFLLVIGRDQSLALVCRQIREVNKKVKIVGVNAFDASIVWKLLGNIGDGIIFTSAFVDYNKNIDADNFRKGYIKKFNEEPNYVSVYGYSITKYLINIVYMTGPDNAQIKEKLQRLDVDSIRGRLKTNEIRDVLSPIGIYLRKQDESILITKVE